MLGCAAKGVTMEYALPMALWSVLFFLYMGIQIGFYVCVPWMLWLIWKKVRHLPG
jgi:hypothetical protein